MVDMNADEGRVPWKSWWQRRNVLVLLAHENCDRCDEVARALADAHGELEEEECAALVVGGAGAPGLVHGYDGDGVLTDRLGFAPGTLVAADRWFEVRAALDAHLGEVGELVRGALEWVRLAERECPECGVPTW